MRCKSTHTAAQFVKMFGFCVPTVAVTSPRQIVFKGQRLVDGAKTLAAYGLIEYSEVDVLLPAAGQVRES